MDLHLQNKVVVLTGASQGIGRAAANLFAEEGSRLLLVARDSDRLEAAGREIHASTGAEVESLAGDLTDPATTIQLMDYARERFGGIDILVNNAPGRVPAGEFLEIDDETWMRGWNNKLQIYIRLSRAVIPLMKERGGGVIVMVNGLAARHPRVSYLPVGASNAALVNFTRGLADYAAPHHILVKGVAPGGTATERFKRLIGERAEAEGKSFDTLWAENASELPLGRLAEPEDVANMICFLASDRTSYINGITISIDGGSTPGLMG